MRNCWLPQWILQPDNKNTWSIIDRGLGEYYTRNFILNILFRFLGKYWGTHLKFFKVHILYFTIGRPFYRSSGDLVRVGFGVFRCCLFLCYTRLDNFCLWHRCRSSDGLVLRCWRNHSLYTIFGTGNWSFCSIIFCEWKDKVLPSELLTCWIYSFQVIPISKSF